MKILAGAITDYEGQIEVNGRPVRFPALGPPRTAGIRIIHQELNLVPQMTVAANIFLGRERTQGAGWLDDRAMEAKPRRLFERLGTPISPQPGSATSGSATSRWSRSPRPWSPEAAVLDHGRADLGTVRCRSRTAVRVINDLRSKRTTILYISHKMNEIFTLSDHVTVLRDGRNVADSPLAQTGAEQVVRWMVGREIAELHFEHKPVDRRTPPPGRGPLARRVRRQRPPLRLSEHQLRGPSRRSGRHRRPARRRPDRTALEALFGAPVSPPPVARSGFDGKPVRFREPGAKRSRPVSPW